MIRQILKRIGRLLADLNTAAILLLIVLGQIALGSCFPQLSSAVAASPEQQASWQSHLQDRYGRSLAEGLAAIGIFDWFHSPLFLVSLALLALVTLVCTLERWQAVWRRTFSPPVLDQFEAAFNRAPWTARLSAPAGISWPGLVRLQLRQRNFRVRTQIAGDAIYVRGDRHQLAAGATLASHLAVVCLVVGASLSSWYGWQEGVIIEPAGIAPIEHGGLALRNDGFAILRYPDGNVATYQAEVAVLENGQEQVRGKVEVNRPLSYRGIRFYLQGYTNTGSDDHLTLLAVYDPGYGLVVIAGFLLLFGVTISFNFPRGWIQARLKADGTLCLAGWAERQAYDSAREFRTLVAELGLPQSQPQAKPPC